MGRLTAVTCNSSSLYCFASPPAAASGSISRDIPVGSGLDKRHEITSQFSPICEEDIIRGYVDSKGNFKESDPPNVFPGTCEDSVEWKDGCLCELMSFRMNRMTKTALHVLDHEYILPVKEITNYFPMTTTLISQPLGGHRTSLMQVAASPSMDDGKLLACLEQVASAMAYLHSRRIIHCDLQCNYIYIDSGYDCPEVMAKVGRWGRAVCLPHPGTDDNLFEPCVRKVMPADAAKWAAPEVRNDGLYSRASDVFSFGIVIWEALTAQLTNLHVFQPLKPFHSLNSREVLKFTELGNIPGDFGFPKLAGLIGCMKACWNHNPTKRPGCILGHIRGDQSRKTSSQGLQGCQARTNASYC
ncbi:focal adhesion kinase 1-like isoform X2 [Struthio camelus]|uniref:focal adhesion kinase 1-like isoform X2 n=1 Tax=Struthio camelus TaxID=8801 RepID=UPI00360409D5